MRPLLLRKQVLLVPTPVGILLRVIVNSALRARNSQEFRAAGTLIDLL